MLRPLSLAFALLVACGRASPPEAPPAPAPEAAPLESPVDPPVAPGTLRFLELASDGPDAVLRAVTFDAEHPTGRVEPRARLPQESAGPWTLEMDGTSALLTVQGQHGYRVDLNTGALLKRFAPLPGAGRLFPCPAGTCALWTVPSEPDAGSGPAAVRAEGKRWPVEGEWEEAALALFRVGHWDEGSGAWIEDDTRALAHDPWDALRPYVAPPSWPIPRGVPLGSAHGWYAADPTTPSSGPMAPSCEGLVGDPRAPGGELAAPKADTGWMLCAGVRAWAHSREWIEGPLDWGPVLVRSNSGWTDLDVGDGRIELAASGRWLLVHAGQTAALIDLAEPKVIGRDLYAAPWPAPP